jgi:excisionase family DNA binding protein
MSQKEYHLTMASTIAELERQVTGLRREVEEMRRFIGLPQGRHSAAFLAWAADHGIDPDDFTPLELAPVGTHTMTVAEAAAALAIGEEQTRRLLRAGTLFGVPLGGRAGWRVSRSAVDELLRERFGPSPRRGRPGDEAEQRDRPRTLTPSTQPGQPRRDPEPLGASSGEARALKAPFGGLGGRVVVLG